MSNVKIIEAYYKAMGEKNLEAVGKYLHQNVEFVAPLGKMQGKEAVLEGAKRFTTLFTKLQVRISCGSQDHAMAVYDLDCPAPVGNFSTAVLMTFKEGLIAKIELFFDARSLEKK